MRFRPIERGPRFRREDGHDRSVATPGIIGFSQCPRSCQDGLFFPHGVSFESDPVRVVDEAIEDGVRDRGIADGPAPFFKGDVAYDERGCAQPSRRVLCSPWPWPMPNSLMA